MKNKFRNCHSPEIVGKNRPILIERFSTLIINDETLISLKMNEIKIITFEKKLCL